MPTFSVIIPAMNEEECLPKLLTAIKSQTLQPLEVIVADAHSTDGTRNIAERFGAKVIDGGLPGPGRNAGAKVATGEILFFLDADIFIEDDHFFEKAVTEFTERGLEVASADLYLVEGTRLEHLGHAFYNKYVRLLAPIHPHGPGGCLIIKKSLHDEIDGFDPTVLFCEDHEYTIRAFKKGKFGYLNSVRFGLNNRRLEKDGKYATAIKFVLAELHMIFIGPIRHNYFKYEFGYGKKETT